jgi:hypothetical protein
MKIALPISKRIFMFFLSFFVSFIEAQQSSCCVTLSSTIGSPGPLSSFIALALSQNGCLAVGYDDGTVRIFPPTNLSACQYPINPSDLTVTTISSPSPGAFVLTLAFSQTGCLAVGYDDGTIRIFPPTNLSLCQYPTSPSDPTVITIMSPGVGFVNAIAFSQNSCLAAGYDDGTVRIFPPTNLSTCQYPTDPTLPPVTIIMSPGAGIANRVAFSPTGCLGVGYFDGTVRIFPPTNLSACQYPTDPTLPPVTTIMSPPGGPDVISLAFSEDSCLGVGYFDTNGTVRIFAPTNLSTCQYPSDPLLASTTISKGSPTFSFPVIAFSQNGCLAVGYTDGTLKTFSPTNLTTCTYSTSPTSNVQTLGSGFLSNVAFSLNGCLAASFQNGSVKIFAPTELGVSILGSTSVCVGGTITLTAEVTGGTPLFTFAWTGPNGFTATTQTITIPNATSANAGTYTVVVTDANGCSTPAQVTINVNQLNAPKLLKAIANCDGTVTVRGTATPNATITVFANGNPLAVGHANAAGIFNFTSSNSLSNGTYTITVQQTVTLLRCSSSSSNAISVIIAQASRPVICATVRCPKVIINGVAEPHSRVTLFANDKKIGTTRSNSKGTFTFRTKLDKGTFHITARSKNSARCKSARSNKVTVKVEKEQEHTPAVCATVLCPDVLINGSAEEDSTITIFANGKKIGTTTADSEGDFTFTTQLIDGTYRITAQSKDDSTRKSRVSNTVTVVVNCQAKLRITLSSPDAPVTSNHRPTLIGTVTVQNTAAVTRAVARATPVERQVTILVDDVFLGTTRSDSNGSFTFIPRNSLSSGTHTFIAEIADNGSIIVSNPVQITLQEQECTSFAKILMNKLCSATE